MAKASDNIFPLVRLAPGTAPATPASGQTVLYVDSADGSFKSKDSTGTVKSVGGSGGNRDYRWFVPSGSTSIDEFNDDTLDPAWVRADGTGAVSANATWTEKGDALSVYNAGADTTGNAHALVRPVGTALAVGDAFVASLRIAGGGLALGGIILTDNPTYGSGNQVIGAIWDSGTPGSNYAAANYAPFAASGWTGFTSTGTAPTAPGSQFVRLVMVAAGSWRVDASPDGISWIIGLTLAKAVTPTHVGLVSSSWGTTTKNVVSYEFLRRVSGIS